MLIFLWILFKQYELHFGHTCSIKNVSKYKLKFKTKPWITPALQKSISTKNNLLKKIVTAKDSQIKERYHKEYKDYRNLLPTEIYNFEAKQNELLQSLL